MEVSVPVNRSPAEYAAKFINYTNRHVFLTGKAGTGKTIDAFKEKAVISSLHRLHLLTLFDYVYIMKNGSIIDEGTFLDLKRSSLIFNEMWKHQEQHLAVHSEEVVALLRAVSE